MKSGIFSVRYWTEFLNAVMLMSVLGCSMRMEEVGWGGYGYLGFGGWAGWGGSVGWVWVRVIAGIGCEWGSILVWLGVWWVRG